MTFVLTFLISQMNAAVKFGFFFSTTLLFPRFHESNVTLAGKKVTREHLPTYLTKKEEEEKITNSPAKLTRGNRVKSVFMVVLKVKKKHKRLVYTGIEINLLFLFKAKPNSDF